MSSIPPVAAAAPLVLQPDSSLAARLALGQLVRAQVLEHQEGSRYLMRILGQTVIAESPVALRAGDTFQGRVVGLQDRVQLERVSLQEQVLEEEALTGLGAGRAAELIEELFRRYRGTLDARDAQALERLVARSSRPERMALAGLVLRKVGLPLDSGLLEALVLALGGELEPIGDQVVELQAGTVGDVVAPAPVQWSPAQRVLNTQGGGTVGHQLGLLPLMLDGRVVEVELALFEENEARERPGALRHRKLVLAFDTDALGRVQARAATAGDHIRVALGTESSAATNALLRYGEGLARALAAAGWQVDEVTHETRARADMSTPVSAALEHLVTPGSVNRVL
jgi:hypothetical protein